MEKNITPISFSGFEEKETKKLRKLKAIAKWFAIIQVIWIMLLLVTIFGTWKVLLKTNALTVFAIAFFYFTALLILTLSVIIKNKNSQSTRLVKPKLIVVFVLGIIPTILGFWPILHAIWTSLTY